MTGMAGYGQRHQPPDPAQMIQHRVDFLTEKLGLSSAQQQQATTIFTNAMGNEKSLRDQMRAAHESLQAAVSRNDSTAIDQAAGSIGGQFYTIPTGTQASYSSTDVGLTEN